MKPGFSLDKVSFELGTKRDLDEFNKIRLERGLDGSFGGIIPPNEHHLSLPASRFGFVVARENGKNIIGFSTFSLMKHSIYIECIAVLDEYSGVLGKVLLKKTETISAKLFKRFHPNQLVSYHLDPAFTLLRHKKERDEFIAKEFKKGRTPEAVRQRWFKMQGYSPNGKSMVNLDPAVKELRHNKDRGEFIAKGFKKGGTPEAMRQRWFKMRGYSPKGKSMIKFVDVRRK